MQCGGCCPVLVRDKSVPYLRPVLPAISYLSLREAQKRVLNIPNFSIFAGTTAYARTLQGVKGCGAVQVAYVLGELTDLSSTTGSAVMALCRGQAPHVAGQLDCMSSFLVACLDHMTASVSLMHGRLPLSESDEALQEIAQCAPSMVAQSR